MNEQTGAHAEAADNYEKAWKYSRKNQPTIGKVSFIVIADHLADSADRVRPGSNVFQGTLGNAFDRDNLQTQRVLCHSR